MISIRFTRTGVIGIGRRDLQEVGREASRATATRWYQKMLPVHFTKRAMQLYSYRPRSGDPGSGRAFKGSYQWRKLKKYANGQGVRAIGEVKPFVWGGRSRELATKNSTITATARNYRESEGRISVPANTLNFVKDASREIRATAPDEERELEDVFGDEYEEQLNRKGRTRRKTTTFKG